MVFWLLLEYVVKGMFPLGRLFLSASLYLFYAPICRHIVYTIVLLTQDAFLFLRLLK